MDHEETENIYDDMFADAHLFDFSNYSPDSPYFSNANKSVLGKMKDECPNSYIEEFVGLRAKMYAYDTVSKDGKRGEVKKAKGVKKSVVNKNIRYQDFKDVLLNRYTMKHKQKGIRSRKHEVVTYEVDKSSINYFDNKTYILPD